MGIQYSSYGTPREDLGEALREFNLDAMDLIADKILPVREVQKKSATVSVLTRENMKTKNVDHANGANFNRKHLKAEDMTYTCKDKGLEEALTQEDRENYASDFDAELEVVQGLKTDIAIAREIRVKGIIFNTTTFTGSDLYTDNSANPWDTAATDIVGQVEAAFQKVRTNCGMKPDTMVIGASVIANLRKNTGIIALFPVMNMTRDALLESLASLFGLKQILVGGGSYDSANDGQDFSGADIWPDDYAMICKVNEGSVKSGGLGRTMLWSNITDQLYTVDSYEEPQSDSEVFRCRQFVDEKIFDAYFGHLMKIDA